MHLGQLVLKLALGHQRWQRIEEIGKLHASAHDLIGRAIAHLLAHELAILGMIKGGERVDEVSGGGIGPA